MGENLPPACTETATRMVNVQPFHEQACCQAQSKGYSCVTCSPYHLGSQRNAVKLKNQADYVYLYPSDKIQIMCISIHRTRSRLCLSPSIGQDPDCVHLHPSDKIQIMSISINRTRSRLCVSPSIGQDPD